jgi:hypothetical protein
MNTSLEKKKLAQKLDNLTTKALKSILTKSGIKVGDYTIVPSDGKFDVKRDGKAYYTTHSKTAAMTLAGLMMKKSKIEDILRVLNADRIAYDMKNNLIIYQYHLDNAINNNDKIRKNLMAFRLDKDDSLYQDAKQVLQSSYSKLF